MEQWVVAHAMCLLSAYLGPMPSARCTSRFLACANKACALCVNNPDKRCVASDNFDEAYADNQTLKAKCKAEVFVQAFLDEPGSGAELPSGLQVQVRARLLRPSFFWLVMLAQARLALMMHVCSCLSWTESAVLTMHRGRQTA